MRNKTCGVYKITNTITGDFYIGSSKDVKRRWNEHKRPSYWKRLPNSPMYYDMQKYGIDKFDFQILAEVEPEQLKEKEQQLIEMLKPTYNNINAKGWDAKRYKDYRKEYYKEYQYSDKYKEHRKEYYKEYQYSDKYKEHRKEYEKSDKRKEYKKEYRNQLCSYNGETLTLNALSARFQRAGVEHYTIEAKKYLIAS